MKDILNNARNIRALLLKIVNGLSDEDASIAPDMFMKPAIACVKELALDKIRLCNADGKAE